MGNADSTEVKDEVQEEEPVGIEPTKRFSSINFKELPVPAILVTGSHRSRCGKTLFCRQWLRLSTPQNKFPLTEEEIKLLDEIPSQSDLLLEVVRCCRMANGTRNPEDKLTGEADSNYRFLASRAVDFADPVKLSKFINGNRARLLEALTCLKTDEKFIRSFQVNQEISRNLMNYLKSAEFVFSGKANRMSVSKTKTAEELVKSGWKTERVDEHMAWIWKVEDSGKLYSLVEANSKDTVSPFKHYFSLQKLEAMIYLTSLAIFLQESQYFDFLAGLESNYLQRPADHVFAIFTFVDIFLKNYKPSAFLAMHWREITSTSPEGALENLEDLTEAKIQQMLVPARKFHVLTLNTHDLDQVRDVKAFICSKIRLPLPAAEGEIPDSSNVNELHQREVSQTPHQSSKEMLEDFCNVNAEL
jgi:hypothetical protein